MKTILATIIAVICSISHAQSLMEGEWGIVAVNQNGVRIEIKEMEMISIKDDKFQFINPDGSVKIDFGRIIIKPDTDSRTRGIHDITVAFGKKHYGRWVIFPIYPKGFEPSDLDLIDPPKPIGMRLITALNNKPDGDRPSTYSPGDNIDVCEWVRFFEME